MSRLDTKPNQSKEDIYLQFTTKERSDYPHIYVDAKNNVHIMVSFMRGVNIGLNNTCQATGELRDFFNDSHKSSGKQAVDQYIEDLNFDLALLKKHPAKNGKRLQKIIQGKEARLRQLLEYQQLFTRLLETDKFRHGSFPDRITAKLINFTNCVNFTLCPSSLDHSLGVPVERSLFAVYRGQGYGLSSALSQFTAVEIVKILGKQKLPEDYEREIVSAVLETYSKTRVNSKADFELLKQLILQQYQKHFPGENLQAIVASYEQVAQASACGAEDPVKDWAEGILHCGKQTGLRFGAAEEKDKKASSKEQSAQGAFVSIAKKIKTEQATGAGYVKAKTLDAFSIAIQLLIATANAHYYAITDHWLNFGTALDPYASKPRNTLIEKIKAAIAANTNIEDAILQGINECYEALGMQQTIPERDWQLIKQTFNDYYTQIEDAPHFDEFLVLLTQKAAGDFYSLRHKIVLPLPVYFNDSKDYKLPSQPVAADTHQLQDSQGIEAVSLSLNLTALLASRSAPAHFAANILLSRKNGKRLVLTLTPAEIQVIRSLRYYGETILNLVYARLSAAEQAEVVRRSLWSPDYYASANSTLLSSTEGLNLQISDGDYTLAPDFKLMLHENSLQRVVKYQRELIAGEKKPGERFLQILKADYAAKKASKVAEKVVEDEKEEKIEVKTGPSGMNSNPLLEVKGDRERKHRVEDENSLEDYIRRLSVAEFYALLARTKKPMTSTSEVALDGSDWNCEEAALLADLMPVTEVNVFADAKSDHETVEASSLAITSSISLTYPQSRTGINPDWEEVVVLSDDKQGDPNQDNGKAIVYGVPILQNVPSGVELIQFENFYKIYERRLLPTLHYLNQEAKLNKQKLILTLPALGIENYSGHFDKKYLKTMLVATLRRLIDENPTSFNQYQCICLDLFETLDEKFESYLLPPFEDEHAVFKIMASGSQPRDTQELSSLRKGEYRRALYRAVSLTEGNGFSWLATPVADQPSNNLAEKLTGLIGKKYADGRVLPIAGKGQQTYLDLIANKQFTTAEPEDWMVLNESQVQSGVVEKKLTPVSELKVERDSKHSKKRESENQSLPENRDLQEAVALFGQLCDIYELKGLLPEKRISLTTGKAAYSMNRSGKALQVAVEERIRNKPAANLLWQWCLKNNGDMKNSHGCIEKIKEIIAFRKLEQHALLKVFINQALVNAYRLDPRQAELYLAQFLQCYQIYKDQQKIGGSLFAESKEIKEREESLSPDSISMSPVETKAREGSLSSLSVSTSSLDLNESVSIIATEELKDRKDEEPKDRKESTSTSNIFDSLKMLAQTGKILAINPKALDLYGKISKEVAEQRDMQLLALLQIKFPNLEALAKIQQPEIDVLNRWWTCRQIVKNTIQVYKRSLGFFNWYGAKRADQLAQTVSCNAPQESMAQITEFLHTGKTECDRSCWAALFSWNRASGTSQTSLRGRLIDQLVGEEKDETRAQRIDRMVAHGAIRLKV